MGLFILGAVQLALAIAYANQEERIERLEKQLY